MPPVFYVTYKLGAWLLGERIQPIAFDPSLDWLLTEGKMIWEPFLLGSLVCGAVSAIIGYFLTRSLWRLQVVKNWQARKLRKPKPKPENAKATGDP